MSAPPPQSKWILPSTASDPGVLPLSIVKLRALRPEIFGPSPGLWPRISWLWQRRQWRDLLDHYHHQLREGDSRAAVAVQLDPLVVAAYTDELDCVAMLTFPQHLVGSEGLSVGSRLLTVNMYYFEPLVPDLVPGPGSLGRYGNFSPFIADFLTDDEARCTERKAAIEDEEWQRTYTLGLEYLRRVGPSVGNFREGVRYGAVPYSGSGRLDETPPDSRQSVSLDDSR